MNKTKRKIFETSMKLFAEKGYDATSVEDIKTLPVSFTFIVISTDPGIRISKSIAAFQSSPITVSLFFNETV